MGWTTLNPSVDSRLIYVSSSTGSNSNDGLTTATPKLTIAAGIALMRSGYPDYLYLKKGDSWSETIDASKSGRSSSEKAVITSYGSGARPKIKPTSGNNGVEVWGASSSRANIAIVGLEIYAESRDPATVGYSTAPATGIYAFMNVSNLLIEDCYIHMFGMNIVVQGYTAVNPSTIVINRNVITDSYNTTGHSQGMYIAALSNISITENVIDHNGWNTSAGANPDVFNHNVYMQYDITGTITVTGNILTRASSHGLQARSGGTVSNNLVDDCAIGILLGGGSPDVTAGGVDATASNNVMLALKDIDGSTFRGHGLEWNNVKSGTISGNIVANKNSSNPYDDGVYAYSWGYSPSMGGIISKNITFTNNIAFKAGDGINATDPIQTSNFSSNNLQVIDAGTHGGWRCVRLNFNPSTGITWSNNNYYYGGGSNAFIDNNGNRTFAQWVTDSGETGATLTQTTFVDSTRTVESYNVTQGGAATLAAFLTVAKAQSQTSWNSAYTAAAVNAYIQAGFTVAGSSSSSSSMSSSNSSSNSSSMSSSHSSASSDSTIPSSSSFSSSSLSNSSSVSSSYSSSDSSSNSSSDSSSNSSSSYSSSSSSNSSSSSSSSSSGNTTMIDFTAIQSISDSDLLTAVRWAIAQIALTGQSYTIAGRTFTQANLNDLRTLERQLNERVNGLSDNGGFSFARFNN